jgi:hypothetical protein
MHTAQYEIISNLNPPVQRGPIKLMPAGYSETAKNIEKSWSKQHEG